MNVSFLNILSDAWMSWNVFIQNIIPYYEFIHIKEKIMFLIASDIVLNKKLLSYVSNITECK